MLSLSKHERLSHAHPFGEHSRIPLPPFDKLMTGFDKLRANGILECSTAVFRIINEIKQIPSDKLVEVYDLIHYFRLGLKHETDALPKQRPIGLAKEIFQMPASFFDPLPDEVLDAFECK